MGIKIIGTSHIAKQSINEIKTAFEEDKPEILALELDSSRAAALMQKQKKSTPLTEIFKMGVKGYLFARVGQYLQQKLGKMVGVAPGSEMMTALKLARQKNLKVFFIDQPINVTLKNLSKELTWKEKGRFVVDFIKGILSLDKQMKKMGFDQFDLHKVPEKEVISKMMEEIKRSYPSIYKTLIEDRNKFMVKKLIKILRENPNKKILVVVGAGHKEGMESLLLKVEVVR